MGKPAMIEDAKASETLTAMLLVCCLTDFGWTFEPDFFAAATPSVELASVSAISEAKTIRGC
jgi:hypothetical protein